MSRGIPKCINLLQAMELDEHTEETKVPMNEEDEDNEMMNLPDEWTYEEQDDNPVEEMKLDKTDKEKEDATNDQQVGPWGDEEKQKAT